MLYDFYKYQNALRPDSVHATYLVCGPKASDIQPDGDVEMSSSMPEHDSFSDTVPTITVTVAKEENLAGNDIMLFDLIAS
jgi:DNA polymerase delta subunit 3